MIVHSFLGGEINFTKLDAQSLSKNYFNKIQSEVCKLSVVTEL